MQWTTTGYWRSGCIHTFMTSVTTENTWLKYGRSFTRWTTGQSSSLRSCVWEGGHVLTDVSSVLCVELMPYNLWDVSLSYATILLLFLGHQISWVIEWMSEWLTECTIFLHGLAQQQRLPGGEEYTTHRAEKACNTTLDDEKYDVCCSDGGLYPARSFSFRPRWRAIMLLVNKLTYSSSISLFVESLTFSIIVLPGNCAGKQYALNDIWLHLKSQFSTVSFIHTCTSDYFRYLRRKQTVSPLPTTSKKCHHTTL